MLKKTLLLLLIFTTSACTGNYFNFINEGLIGKTNEDDGKQRYDLMQHMTNDDMDFNESALQDALEHNHNNVSSKWKNEDSSNFGSITPIDFYNNDKGEDCRNFKQNLSTLRGTVELHSKACRKGKKKWEILDNN